MTPEFVEEEMRAEAEKMGLGEALTAYGYERVEYETLCNIFGEMKKRHPRIVKEYIRGNLDFYLSPVEDEGEE